MRFFAYSDPDPTAMREMDRVLRSSRRFGWVGHPNCRWLAATTVAPVDPRVVLLDGDLAADGIGRALDEQEFLATLRGSRADCTFAQFDVGGELRLVRGAASVVPFYLWRRGERLACASRLGEIAAFVPDEPELEPLVNATCCTMFGWLGDRRTFLRDVLMLRMGDAARTSGREWTVSEWWKPALTHPQRPSKNVAIEHQERFRTYLVTNLSKAFDQRGTTLITFSGGVDSSALVSLAAGLLGKTFATVSFLPTEEPQHRTSKALVDSLLASFAPNISARWEFDHSMPARLAYVAGAPREVFQVPHPALCLMRNLLSSAPITTLCGGEYCDDLFGSHLTREDWDVSHSFAEVVRHLDELPNGVRSLFGWLRRRARIRLRRAPLHRPESLPGFVRHDLQAEYREVLREQRRQLATDDRPRPFIAKRLEVAQTAIAQNWEVTSALGVRRVYPFLSRELVELAFACHPSEGLGPGTKKLVREALAGLVPESHLGEKQGWSSHPASVPWNIPLPGALGSIVRRDLMDRAPRQLPAFDALRLTLLLNISQALSTARAERRAL